ncbi:hypothetical protein RRG08_033433 [Elysia crispata]|uniref:Uncharacterized protein n=1 Tax=Elysia crispata TaxID=231223 RepID=A0AAE1AUW5_9GAST|nr:hypothetical protein RRG08_033433 [Elysia crispata]
MWIKTDARLMSRRDKTRGRALYSLTITTPVMWIKTDARLMSRRDKTRGRALYSPTSPTTRTPVIWPARSPSDVHPAEQEKLSTEILSILLIYR